MKVPVRGNKAFAIALTLAVLAALGLGFLWGHQYVGGDGISSCSESLIDPALCSGNTNSQSQVSYQAFRTDLEDHLMGVEAKGKVTHVGIYFRDLRNGPTLSVNAGDGFLPMSLMKMPLMVSILRYAQDHPEVLKETVHTPPSFAANVQVMDQAQTLLPDHDYTIDELLTYMIAYSDNRALGELSVWMDQKAGRGAVVDTLVNLGLMRRQDTLPEATVSPRTYGEILRILYGAAYLNADYSQKALDYLTRSTFKDGIAHDVPSDVRIAHKFGVNDDGNGTVQLHDCGIVYHPAGPYILCVMTEGSDYVSQASYIQDVAARVYEHVSESHNQ